MKKGCILFALFLLTALLCMGFALADTVVIPAGTVKIEDEAFMGSAGFSDLVIQEGTVSIGSRSFANCGTLSVRLPDSLTYIAEDAFKNTAVTVTANRDTYAWKWAEKQGLEPSFLSNDYRYDIVDGAARIRGYWGEADTVVIPSRIDGYPVRILGERSFAYKDFSNVIIPEGIATLESFCFSGCGSLKKISIPSTVESIGESAFQYCGALEDAVFCEGLKSIGESAFSETSLTSVTIPKSVTSIGEKAFFNCNSLQTLNLDNCTADIGAEAFYGCSSLLKLSVPGNVKNIGKKAFGSCYELRSVTVKSGVEAIGNDAFIDCRALTKLTLEAGLKTIGVRAFAYCNALTEVTIPDGVESIGSYAFMDCESLTKLSMAGGLFIAEGAFDCGSLEITFRGGPLTLHEAALAYGRFLIHCSAIPEGVDSSLKYGAVALIWDTGKQTIADDNKTASGELQTRNSDNRGDEYGGSWTGNYAVTTTSYLVPGAGGTYTRVQYISDMVRIEEYAADGSMTWSRDIAAELPLWGGFYSGTEYNFLVFGQENLSEDDGVEVMRVVKYTKNWNRVSQASVFGANTTIPFRAGSLDMAQSGDILYIMTSHQMYTTSDGLRHQANMGYDIYIPNMQFIRQGYQVGGSTYEYVSHSFNQKVIIDGDDVIKVNHGDAYPRSIVLLKVDNIAGTINMNNTEEVDILSISGEIGNNVTGAALGDVVASSTHYLVSGSSIDQSLFGSSSQRNIFVGTVPKEDVTQENVSLKWITSHASSGYVSVSAPHLVKISNYRFLLLWKEEDVLKYVFLNASGDMTTEIFSGQGEISDCRPVLMNGQVTWYVSSDDEITYYSISITAPYALTTR